jgi:uncharacterized protein
VAPEGIAALAAHWGVTTDGNWEGTNVLHRPGATDAPDELIERGRAALLAVRDARVRPARDDKQLASWNGLALRALAHGALVLDDDRYLDATRKLVAFVTTQLVRDEDRLWRTSRDGRAHTPAFAEDYVAVADGLLGAHAALATVEPLLLARRLADTAIREFWDDAARTLVDTSDEHDATVARPRGLVDNAVPSANSVAADVFQRLTLLTGEEAYADRARWILRAVASGLERQPSAFGRMLAAADRQLGEPMDVVVAVPASHDPNGWHLRRAAAAPFEPDLVIAVATEGDATGEWAVLAGKAARDGRATAYACRGYACDAPTADPDVLVAQVRALRLG